VAKVIADLITINAGVVLGIILGVSLLPLQPSEDAITLIMFPGEILMRLLKQLIIPIVVASIITGKTRISLSFDHEKQKYFDILYDIR